MLNKALPLIFAFLFLTLTVQAQNIGLGINAGFNASSHINNFRYSAAGTELDLKPDFTFNYNFGLMYRYIFSRHLRIQAEPTFIQLGASYDDQFTYSGNEFQSDSETKLTYIQLPVLVQLTTTPPDRLEFPKPWPTTTYHLTGGVYGGYLLDAQFSGTNTGEPIGIEFQGDFSNDITDQYRKYDAGVVLGFGFEYGLDTKVGVEMRGMMGVLSTGDNPEVDFKGRNLAFTTVVYFLM